MKKKILICVMFFAVTTADAQFWGGFLQGALMGTQNAIRQQQIRKQQEQERRRKEELRRRQKEANKIEKDLIIETGFKWYKVKQRGKVGAEDYYDKTLIPLSRGYDRIYFRAEDGHVGYFKVEKNGKSGVCDITGKEIVSPSYESVIYVSDGFNYKNSSGNFVPVGWYLDSQGIATREAPINKNLQTEKDGYQWYEVRQGEKYGAEDYQNRTLIPLSREYTSVFYRPEEGHKGYFSVKKSNKYGACDLTGKEIAQPIYDFIVYTSGGFEYQNSEGQWTALGWMLDSEGKAIKGTKESVTYNGATYYIVSRDGLYGLTDAKGKEIIPMEMEKIETAGGNRLKFKQNDSWGLINFLGKVLVPSSRGYTSIGKYSKTQKTFAYTMYGFKGEIDINGRQLSKIKVATPQQATSKTSIASTKSSSSIASSSKSISNNNSENNTTTVVVEHHRDPVPVQEWVQCTACWGSTICPNCAGSGTTYIGDRLHRCSRCGGRKICTSCSGQGGRYYTVYK